MILIRAYFTLDLLLSIQLQRTCVVHISCVFLSLIFWLAFGPSYNEVFLFMYTCLMGLLLIALSYIPVRQNVPLIPVTCNNFIASFFIALLFS